MSKKLTKDNVQDEAVELSKTNNRLLLKHGTGLGKSLSFIKIQEYHKPKSVYIIVAERNHVQNWINEYKKHGKEELLKTVTFFCYASLKKYINTTVDMICLDEGHHVSSDIRLDYLSSMRYNNLVLLSATIKNDQLQKIEGITGVFYKYKIPLAEAIEAEIIPIPTFYLIPLELNNATTELIEFSRGNKQKHEKIYCEFKDRFKYIVNKKDYPNLHLVIRCTQYQKDQYLTNTYNYYKNKYFETRRIIDKNKWLLSGSERKRYLAGIKTSYIQKLLTKFQNKRFICFCGSIKQARILSEDKNLICSDHYDIDKIKMFNDGLIDNLFVVDMLKEGENLNNVEVGVIVQLDGETGSFIQKSGRIMRSKNPIIYLFYFKGTRDEVYLDNVLKEISIEHIRTVDNIDNINLI